MKEIEIVGVYKVDLTPQKLRDNFVAEFGEYYDHLPPPEELLMQYGERLSIIEIKIQNLPANFYFGNITQEFTGYARDYWQVPYGEKFLDEDGNSVAGTPNAGSSARFAFFFHITQFDKPLITPWGNIQLPKPTKVPERISKLFRYIPP